MIGHAQHPQHIQREHARGDLRRLLRIAGLLLAVVLPFLVYVGLTVSTVEVEYRLNRLHRERRELLTRLRALEVDCALARGREPVAAAAAATGLTATQAADVYRLDIAASAAAGARAREEAP